MLNAMAQSSAFQQNAGKLAFWQFSVEHRDFMALPVLIAWRRDAAARQTQLVWCARSCGFWKRLAVTGLAKLPGRWVALLCMVLDMRFLSHPQPVAFWAIPEGPRSSLRAPVGFWRIYRNVTSLWRKRKQMKAIKQIITSGKTAIGTTAGPNIDVSVLADAGFDFILFDTQHSPYEIKQLAPSIQAMRGKKAAPLVRVAANQADQICFALDAGARGIIAPMINTRAEAEAMVRSCRYYPLGNRSNAGVRGEWGEFPKYRDYLDTVNKELVIVPMIETRQALENLDAIASVPGVDVLLIGPSDLSIELDVPLDYACDTYQRALDKIAATAAKHGIAAGMYFIPPGMEPNFFVDKGFKFFTMPWGPWAATGIQNAIAGIKR
jgi:2-keto-3-deoxy-L-rhamnonate aldolase RhmA